MRTRRVRAALVLLLAMAGAPVLVGGAHADDPVDVDEALAGFDDPIGSDEAPPGDDALDSVLEGFGDAVPTPSPDTEDVVPGADATAGAGVAAHRPG